MKKYTPTLLALFTLLGVFIGVQISGDKYQTIIVPQGITKVDELMQLVHDRYVDSVSMDEII